MVKLKNEPGILLLDDSLSILSWNPQMENFTGIPESDVKNNNILSLFPEIAERGLKAKLLSALNKKEVIILSATLHKYFIKCKPQYKSNKFKEMQQHTTIAPIMDDVSIKGLIITIEDMTHLIENDSQPQEKVELNEQEGKSKADELTKKEWEDRKDFVDDMEKYSGMSFINELIEKIKNEHDNLNVISSILPVLAKRPEDLTKILLELVNYNDADVRIYAVQTLGLRPDPKSVDALISCLNDSNKNVQYYAIEALGNIKSEKSIGPLIEIAKSGEFFTAFPAIESLRKIGEPLTALMLTELLNKEYLQPAIIEALGEIGEINVLPKLIELLNNGSEYGVQICASIISIYRRLKSQFSEGNLVVEGFKKEITESGIETLIGLVNKSSGKELEQVVRIVTWLDGKRVEQLLRILLDDETVRKIVLDALVGMGKKATQFLCDQFTEGDDEKNKAIIIALGSICDARSVEYLIKFLDASREIIVLVMGALAKIGSREVFTKILPLIGHEDAIVRRAAISALNSIGHPLMNKKMSVLLGNKNPLIRESAAKITGYFGFENCYDQMMRCCLDIDENVRCSAIELIALYDNESVLKLLSNVLEKDTAKCKRAAAKSLQFLTGVNLKDLIEKILKDEDQWVRINAIRTAAVQKITELVPIITKMALEDSSIPVKISAIECIGELGGVKILPILTAYIENKNRDISTAALRSIGNISHPNADQVLIAVLNKNDQLMKIAALQTLSKREGLNVIEAVEWCALTESDLDIAFTALNSLRKIGTYEATQCMIGLLKDERLREKIIDLLSEYDSNKIHMFSKGLENSNKKVRTALVVIFTRMRHPDATKLIINCLNDEAPEVRIAALNGLRRLGNTSEIKLISSISANDSNKLVRDVAVNYLEQFNER